VVLPSIPDPEKFAEDERLDPKKLVNDIKATGTEAWYLGEVDEIVAHVTERAVEGDVIVVLSNGGFGGIHQKLLAAL
jgi:UDP-N-acetylmuramate: L-alanyl-gamma-D-glutamyl-meso-diaminopimelate ligase